MNAPLDFFNKEKQDQESQKVADTPKSTLQLDESWKEILTEEFDKEYFQNLKAFLKEEKSKGQTIFPPGKEIFNALNTTPFDKVKVVILGQDPYHGPGQAHGLCFSVQDGVKPPPSLLNIYKELHNDVGMDIPLTGNLLPWAKQGVLLLNATLTVRARKPGSHQNRGWEQFTDAVISMVSAKKSGVVFLLWGKYAQDKGAVIDPVKHYVLKSPHPSPYSADRGFFGCRHFSQANQFLMNQGLEEINWSL
ncbi:MAG: uracil-DNA glycosylase [Bacteroidetes bacterium]|nr:MAG: uracil-DNA glycosylase [Bacteroidota bacterium]